MLKINVKAGSITHLTDARYFAAWGVEWLGFPLKSAETAEVDPITVKAIKEWIDGVKIIGEIDVPTSAKELQEFIEQIGLQALQAGNNINAKHLADWKLQIPVIKEIIINNTTKQETLELLIRQCAPYVFAFLLNFKTDDFDLNHSIPFDKHFLKNLCEKHKVILEANFTSADLPDILELLPLYGISVKGGEEEKTGVKSFDELDEIFEVISDEGI